jgi:ribonuclease BN (tRNA processing enzyme)
MKIRVLGCSGTIARDCRTTSFLIDHDLLIDAGTGVGDLELAQLEQINDIFITHCHLDHIAALPLMIDAVASLRNTPIRVHALPETIESLKNHIFNNEIWPDFTKIPHPDSPLLEYLPIQIGDVVDINDKRIQVLPAVHIVPATGYAVKSLESNSPYWVFSGDTAHNPAFWEIVNQLPVGALVIETAFSEQEKEIAVLSQHLSPSGLEEELSYMENPSAYPIYITHTKPAAINRIVAEVTNINHQRIALGLSPYQIHWLSAGQMITL